MELKKTRANVETHESPGEKRLAREMWKVESVEDSANVSVMKCENKGSLI